MIYISFDILQIFLLSPCQMFLFNRTKKTKDHAYRISVHLNVVFSCCTI